MKKVLKIMNHPLSEEQKDYLKKEFNVMEFIFLPEQLQNYLKNIPADKDLDLTILKEITTFLKEKISLKDYVIIQGEFGITFYLVDFCLRNDYIPIYATTKRVYEEKINKDGTVERKHLFKFVNFRKYEKSQI